MKNTGLKSWGMGYKSGYFVTRYSLLIAFLILVAGYWLLATPAEAQLAGKITKVEGRVDILRAAAAAAVPARVGDPVNVGDILRTKSDGKAEIAFIDNTTMTVGPKSRLGIEEYLYKADEEKRSASLKLYRGRTGFQIPKPVYPAEGSKFEMKTRTAVAGVRGTEGILYTDGVERVYVKEGVIEFKNPLGSVTVSKGEVGEVFAGRAPVERPYSEREYQQQERQVTPAPSGRAEASEASPAPSERAEASEASPASSERAEASEASPAPSGGVDALPAEVPPPLPAALPETPEIVLQPLPPPDLPNITDITLNKVFTASASILDGEIQWLMPADSPDEGTAAVIQSGLVSGNFNQTILEGGYYELDMSGSYAWVAGRSVAPSSNATDDQFHFFYSGSADGKPFYGGSAGDILRDPNNPDLVHPDKLWSGENMGWIEDGSKKYWYIGGLSGSYTNILYNNNHGDRTGQSGTFTAKADGFFWDGSRPLWEAFDKIIPTLPSRPDFFVPITETALRTYDISGSGTLNISGSETAGTTGTISTSISGKGIELTPGSGLFDVNVTGNGSLSSGSFSNLIEIYGTINATTSITGATVYQMKIEGGIKTLDSTTAIVGAHIISSTTDAGGVMVGKMTATSSTSVTLDAKAIGEVQSGFLLP